VAIATMPDYLASGLLTIVDVATGTVPAQHIIAADQSVTALATDPAAGVLFGGTGADRGNKGDDASRLPGVSIFRRDLATGQLTTRALAGRYYVWGVATSGSPARLLALVSGERHGGKRAFRLVDLDPVTLTIRQEVGLGDHGWGSLGALPGAGAAGALVLRTDDDITALDLSKLVPGATTGTPGLLTQVVRGWSPVVLGDGTWVYVRGTDLYAVQPRLPFLTGG
jgi:hypothetical protein